MQRTQYDHLVHARTHVGYNTFVGGDAEVKVWPRLRGLRWDRPYVPRARFDNNDEYFSTDPPTIRIACI